MENATLVSDTTPTINLGLEILYGLTTMKVIQGVTRFSCHMTPWILVFLSIEQLVAVYFPTHHKQWCARKCAVVMIILLSLTIFLYDSAEGAVFVIEDGQCSIGKKYSYFNETKITLDILLLSVGPFIIMSTLTLAIVIKLILNRKRGNQKVASLTGLLTTVNNVFLLTILPCIVFFTTWEDLVSNIRTLQDIENFRILEVVSILLYGCNNCVNSFYYVVSSSRFRAELSEMFTNLRVNKIRIHNSTSSTNAK